MTQKKTTDASMLDPSDSPEEKTQLILPRNEELAACEHDEDWFLLALEKNPHVNHDTLHSAYLRSDFYRKAQKPRRQKPVSEQDFAALQEVVKAGSQAVADFKARRDHERDVRQRFKTSNTWEEWARLYISEHPTAKAWQVRDAMIGATHGYSQLIDVSKMLGTFPGLEDLESWQLEAGAGGMTPEKLREHRALKAQPAHPSTATQSQSPGAQTLRAPLLSQALLERNERRWGDGFSNPGKPLEPLDQVPLSAATREFFAQFHVPETLQDFLEKHSYNDSAGLGALMFDQVNSFARESLVTNHSFIKNGLLVVGRGRNGDPIAVDLATFSTCYLNHEAGWEDDDEEEEPLDMRDPECFVDTGLDPGTFFLAATLYEKGFPMDSYAARELQKNFKDSSFAELFLL